MDYCYLLTLYRILYRFYDESFYLNFRFKTFSIEIHLPLWKCLVILFTFVSKTLPDKLSDAYVCVCVFSMGDVHSSYSAVRSIENPVHKITNQRNLFGFYGHIKWIKKLFFMHTFNSRGTWSAVIFFSSFVYMLKQLHCKIQTTKMFPIHSFIGGKLSRTRYNPFRIELAANFTGLFSFFFSIIFHALFSLSVSPFFRLCFFGFSQSNKVINFQWSILQCTDLHLTSKTSLSTYTHSLYYSMSVKTTFLVFVTALVLLQCFFLMPRENLMFILVAKWKCQMVL